MAWIAYINDKMTKKFLAILFISMNMIVATTAHGSCITDLSLGPSQYLDPEVIKQRILQSGHAGQFLVGFQPDASGKIQPIWSENRKFSSNRYVPTSGGIFGSGWNPRREALLVNLSFIKLKKLDIIEEPTVAFPIAIRNRLNRNEVPETNGINTEPTYEAMKAILEKPNDQWQVLMMAASSNKDEAMLEREGRTGVLLLAGLPFIQILSDGSEQLLEAKGIGLPSGGFQQPIRSTHGSISGGISANKVEQEFQVAKDISEITNVRIPLVAKYSSDWGEQGIAFRWSPGTRRASFQFVNEENYLVVNAKELSVQLGETVAQLLAKGYLPRIHMENFVVSSKSTRAELTDFSDINPISSIMSLENAVNEITDHLDLLLNGNYNNLIYHFDRTGFLDGIIRQAVRLGMPSSEYTISYDSPIGRPKTSASRQNESYIRATDDSNLQYVIQRFLTVGIVRSLGTTPINFYHNIDVSQKLSNIERDLGELKGSYEKLELDVKKIRLAIGGDRPDHFDSSVLSDYERAKVRHDLGWNLNGARNFFSQGHFHFSYNRYLISAAIHSFANHNTKQYGIMGSVEKIPELYTIISAQKNMVMKLDLIWFSYTQVGRATEAQYYKEILDRVLQLDPIEFLLQFGKN